MKNDKILLLTITSVIGLAGCQATSISDTLTGISDSISNSAIVKKVQDNIKKNKPEVDTHATTAGYAHMLERHPDIGKIPYAYHHKPHVIKMTDVYLGMSVQELKNVTGIYPFSNNMEYKASITPSREGAQEYAIGLASGSKPGIVVPINICSSKKRNNDEWYDYNSIFGFSKCKYPVQGINTKTVPALRYAQDVENAIGYGLYHTYYEGSLKRFSFSEGFSNKPEAFFYSHRITTDMNDRVIAFSVTRRFPFKAGFFEEQEKVLSEKAKGLKVNFKEFTEGFNAGGLRSIAYTVGADDSHIPLDTAWLSNYRSGKTTPLYMVSTIDDKNKYGIHALESRAPYEITLSCDLEARDYCYVNHQQNAIFSSYQASSEILKKHKIKINEMITRYVNNN